MSQSQLGKFQVIRDSREKDGWTFRKTDYCEGTIVDKVEHGDYSIKGLESLVFIERKASVSEIANNITEKRFPKLLAAAGAYKYRYIIFEFDMQEVLDFPYASDLPRSVKKRIRIKPNFILKNLHDMCIKYKIIPVFCGDADSARRFTLSLLKHIHKEECKTGPVS